MTASEKVYTALAICMALFMLMGVAVLALVVLPRAEDPGVMQMVICVNLLEFVALSVTAAVNLVKRELLVVSTIVQSVVLLLTVWGIPIGVMGFVLIYRKMKRDKHNPQPARDAAAQP